MISAILFDLDGTLTDPKIGITKSVQYSLEKFRIEIKELDELNKFIGPPLKESFIKYYSFTDRDATNAIKFYREYFSEKGMYENRIYNGIPQILETLKDKRLKMAVATSKPTYFAKKILDHFKMGKYFDKIIGSNLDNSRTDKKEIIEYTLRQMKMKKDDSIMVGDRKHDIIGAKANLIKSIGVLYGYGDKREIEYEKPDYIANDVLGLGEILNQLTTV